MLRMLRIEQDILAKNDRYAAENRDSWARRGVLALNLLSSPGSGKTSLLVRTINDLKDSYAIAVIEGDQQTANDAQRIRATGAPAVQINTGKGCHLDAHMVGHQALTDRLHQRSVGLERIQRAGQVGRYAFGGVLVLEAVAGLVRLQRGKGADAGTGFGAGASGTVFGARGSATFFSRATGVLATMFFVTSLALAYLSTQRTAPASLLESTPPAQSAPQTAPASPPAQELPTLPSEPALTVIFVFPPPVAQVMAGFAPSAEIAIARGERPTGTVFRVRPAAGSTTDSVPASKLVT